MRFRYLQGMRFVAALGLMVLGGLFLAPRGHAAAKSVPTLPPAGGEPVLYSSEATQSRILSDKSLGALALENSGLGGRGTSFGFAAKSPEARYFLVGTYYSEALALARSANWEEAAKRMEAIEQALLALNAPAGLLSYVGRAKHHLVRGDLPPELAADYLSLFQPLFSDFARGQSQDKLALFTTGAWLVDMSLAAAAGDVMVLRQQPVVRRAVEDMKRMDAPKGVQEALADIASISAQDKVSEQDAKKVLSLVRRIQSLLG